MRIKHVEIENFRLLRHVAIGLEERTTLIVGRNNSGTTSIAELFRRLLYERALSFKLEDFSLGCHECFWTAFDEFRGGAAQSDVLAHLPSITITLDLAYDVDAHDLGPLSDCIIYLTPDYTVARPVLTFGPRATSQHTTLSGIVD